MGGRRGAFPPGSGPGPIVATGGFGAGVAPIGFRPEVSSTMNRIRQRRSTGFALGLSAALLCGLLSGAAPCLAEPPPLTGPEGETLAPAGQAVLAEAQDSGAVDAFPELVSRFLETLSGSPVVPGNTVTLLVDGPATYAAMLQAIQAAKARIQFESYIFEDDEVGRRFADLLLLKRQQGVAVELIYDSVGSMATPSAFFQRLRDGGILVREFNPINPARVRGWKWQVASRDHRKLLIVDGRLAFTGGINISKVYSSMLYRHHRKTSRAAPGQPAWRDTDVQIEGPVVLEFQKLFEETWARQGGASRPRTPLPAPRPDGLDLVQVMGSTPGGEHRFTYLMYVSAFTLARRSIHLTTAYFAPDDQLLSALARAARQGLDVEIILPGVSDSNLLSSASRACYTLLMASGVKVYERRRDSMLHAKTAVVDGVWSTVGSSNLDPLSFINNDEVNAIILSRPFGAAMEAMFQDDLQQANRILPEAWKRRPVPERLREWLALRLGGWL